MDIELICQNPWMQDLSEEVKQELLNAAHFRRFVPNQLVCSQQDLADGLYAVVSGEIRISAITHDGEEIVFTRLLPGSWFGEIALLDGVHHTHDAHASIETELAIVPKQALMQICEKYPIVYRSLVKLLCTHCRRAFAAIDDFLLFSPSQRMAKRIMSSLSAGADNCLSLKQQELGALIGISRQSTYKILKSWEEQGWVRRGYGKLEVLNEKALRDLVRNKFL